MAQPAAYSERLQLRACRAEKQARPRTTNHAAKSGVLQSERKERAAEAAGKQEDAGNATKPEAGDARRKWLCEMFGRKFHNTVCD